MTKIGEYPIQRSDGGWDYIDIHEPGTFDQDPLLVQLSDGSWGVPYLVPLGEGDTGLLVQKSDGSWLQANEQGILVVEDWEQGYRDTDTWNWTDTDFTGSSTVHSTYSVEGTYSLRLTDYYHTVAMPDYPEPAPHLPLELGDTIRTQFIMPHSGDIDSGQQYWFIFLLQHAPHHTTTPDGDQTMDDYYSADVITGSNDLFRISKRSGGRTSYSGDASSTVDWEAGVWYQIDVTPTSTEIIVDLYKRNDQGGWNDITKLVGPAPDWTSGGIGFRNPDGGRSNWDVTKFVPN